MAEQQKVKNQHYVPQRYLRAFANKHNNSYKFNVYDKEKEQQRSGNVEQYASERYFYDVDFESLKRDVESKHPDFEFDPEMDKLMKEVDPQHLEHFFAQNVETYLFDPIPQIITSYFMINPVKRLETNILNDDQMNKISMYLAIQQVRSKEFRQTIVETYEKLPLVLMKKMAKSDEEREFLEGIKIELANDNQKKLLHAQMILDQESVTKLAIVFREKLWFVLINETDVPFYTSDNPLVRYGHCNEMGYASKGIEIAFPINSKLLLVLRDRDFFGGDSQYHNHFLRIEKENVIFYNALQVQQSYRYVFCKEDKFNLAEEIMKKEPELKNIKHDRFFMG